MRDGHEGERVERDPQEWYDEEKRKIALVYRRYLDQVRDDDAYERVKRDHSERYGSERKRTRRERNGEE